ncbi:MAG: hypothetical protein VX403_07065 [Planctomycetota bacterium]|nr:hypothetical protein [Planctomycetota bacterium]
MIHHRLGTVFGLLPIVAITLALPGAGATLGPDWDGDCNQDSGSKPSTAQVVRYASISEVKTIRGCLKGPTAVGTFSGASDGDYQDMYKVVIRTPGKFRISTLQPEGFTEFDSLLTVFDFRGRPLLANVVGEQGLVGSAVGNQSTNGEFEIREPGAIFIAITGASARPLDVEGNPMFDFGSNLTDVVGPISESVGRIGGWDQPLPSNEYGDYLISLTAVGPVPDGCGSPNSGPCDLPNPFPFCSNFECCESVCAIDPFCCEATWDGSCVLTSKLVCVDGLAGCGASNTGPCDSVATQPFCSDPVCCALTCAENPRCCEVEWDQSCVSIASQLCGTFCNETCREDLDGDNLINGSDLTLLLNAWDTDGCPDLDGNGKVNGADLAILLARWGQSCP